MDPRLRLQPGMADYPSHLHARTPTPYSLRILQQQQQQLGAERTRHEFAQARALPNPNVPTLVPSLSSGQGFYTVESLQGASMGPPLPRQDALASYPHLVSYDPGRSYVGGSLGAGQQGLELASANYLLAHQAANQKFVVQVPPTGAGVVHAPLLSHSLQTVHTGGALQPATGSAYGVSSYSQADLSSAQPRYLPPSAATGASDSALLLREQERLREFDRARERDRDRARGRAQEHERERERERDRERERRRRRERDQREWSRERRHDIERRRERERRRELAKRRDTARRRDSEHEGRSGGKQGHKKETASLNKPDKLPLRAPRSDRPDEAKSRNLRGHEKKGKAWCSICEIDCDTPEILDRHLHGKKHKTQVEAKEQKDSGKPENAITEADQDSLKKLKVSEGKLKVNVSAMGSKPAKSKSKAGTSKDAEDRVAVKETNELNSIQKGATVEPVTCFTEGETGVEHLPPLEGELKDVNVLSSLCNVFSVEEVKEAKSKDIIVKEVTVNGGPEGANADSQPTEAVKDPDIEPSKALVKEATDKLVGHVDTVKAENKLIGSEVVNETICGDVEIRVLPDQNIATSLKADLQGKKTILGKRTLDVDSVKPLKKTWPLKKKAVGVGTVQPGTVRCEVCKVVCRNATVYETHLKGEKHAERLEKSIAQEAGATVKSEPSLT